jgi:hypothetical protein
MPVMMAVPSTVPTLLFLEGPTAHDPTLLPRARAPRRCGARARCRSARRIAALRGFSVLAHQAVVDRSWDDAIVPALRRRFPDVDADALERAHAFAHGGSHVADLGYFPFGNRMPSRSARRRIT